EVAQGADRKREPQDCGINSRLHQDHYRSYQCGCEYQDAETYVGYPMYPDQRTAFPASGVREQDLRQRNRGCTAVRAFARHSHEVYRPASMANTNRWRNARANGERSTAA